VVAYAYNPSTFVASLDCILRQSQRKKKRLFRNDWKFYASEKSQGRGSGARCWWLTSVILAIWKTEISRLAVQDELQQIHKTPSQPIAECSGVCLSMVGSIK
jgi:hypothetical protein